MYGSAPLVFDMSSPEADVSKVMRKAMYTYSSKQGTRTFMGIVKAGADVTEAPLLSFYFKHSLSNKYYSCADTT